MVKLFIFIGHLAIVKHNFENMSSMKNYLWLPVLVDCLGEG